MSLAARTGQMRDGMDVEYPGMNPAIDSSTPGNIGSLTPASANQGSMTYGSSYQVFIACNILLLTGVVVSGNKYTNNEPRKYDLRPRAHCRVSKHKPG